jgi:glycosyltransferase involved in cell wall biosynthesis
MKLAVIIPLYNRGSMISAALRSIVRQAGAIDLDVVVVDDGSSDDGPAVVQAMASTCPMIRLVPQTHRGVTAARNNGLSQLHPESELITFLDSDDLSPQGRFAAELRYFRNDPGLEVTYGLMTLVDRLDDEKLAPAAGSRTVTVRGVSLSAGIFRREWFDRLGGFDEAFESAEDADFLFRLFERSPRLVLSDIVAVFYRRHAGNLTKDKTGLRRQLMLAIHKSVSRRRRDPSLAGLDKIFDMNGLLGVEWL